MTASAVINLWKTAAPVDGIELPAGQPTWWPPGLARVYVETVRIHWRTVTPEKLTELRGLLKVAKADLQWDKVYTKRGRQGAFITVHRMTLSDAITLHKFCEANAELLPNLNRFDLAIEYPRHPEMTRWLKQNIILLGCPPGWMMTIGDSQYWHFIPEDADGELSAPTKALKCYDDRLKFGDEVSRVELTFQTTQSNKRLGFSTIADLIAMNPLQLLRDHIRIVDYKPEWVVARILKRTMAEKLKNPPHVRSKKPSAAAAAVYDRFRDPNYLRARIINHHQRCGNDIETAQGYKNSLGERRMRRWTAISVDALNVPEQLWWPQTAKIAANGYDHLTPATPLLKNHNEINETTADDDLTANTQD